ncbi:hypothetical protein COL922a_011136 [Colletotrichum nupharicola]|nr:hypothetical protein COL922a_011136 [Colletotrichum nupharicola]
MIVSLYSGYEDYAIIVGDMHIELVSASALQQPQQIRVETAKTFAVKIIQTNKDIKKCNVACIDAARKALTTLVEAFNDWGNDKQTSWTMLLNIHRIGVRADIDQFAIREEALQRLQDFSSAC